MATINIPSPSGTPYQSYSDVATADAYAGGVFGPEGDTWRAAVTDDKGRALVTATNQINVMSWQSGYPDDTAWLAAVVNGCIILAMSILDGSLTSAAAQAKDPTKILKAGSAQIQYFRSLSVPSVIPVAFTQLMSQWLGSADSQCSPSGSSSYGVDECSAFDKTYKTSQGVG